MTLYFDIIWLLNFFIDLMLLILTAAVLKKDVPKTRLIIGALFASLYIWCLIVPALELLTHPVLKGFYSVLIILITFKFNTFGSFIQTLLMFYFVNFAVGGALIGIHFFLHVDPAFIGGSLGPGTTSFGSPIGWLFVLVGFPLVFYYSKQRFETIETVKMRYDATMNVHVELQGYHIQLRGFIDSGNQLTDPFSKKPVMIIDMTETADQFPKTLVNFSKRSPGDLTNVEEENIGNVSLIPFRTVGSQQQFLWTVKPDKVTVYENGSSFECPRTLLGLSHVPLGEKEEYNCLLHPAMMQQKKQAQ
ncbi:sigma-E processing peptidase SpoIIGA [Salipaludibacillus sp. LMS25]|jgi:stage II sporulation protein GA (sporulation sigma-E factor processing peptidase)|uniref:sigma-E processing peptidase SpoIIGA n=1 Tax=Salipaludibacillus sp. LMS25 TaxID=2924031 RepID=UPI0020D13D39|nr:sigma-E processing peptidase SpoIIGA [Salipaludibacillus sp. LMS25]UTR15178.1 sigma-E processing peptidase SpoIIGA [Salipaludibacillus sp. LMS25]